jgi:pimeloyl-ACP methyl ester carboxylesterase
MRPIELLLSLANLLTFFALAVRLPRAMRWMSYSAPIAVLIAIVQVSLEGGRWQMIPAYSLAGLLVLVWLRKDIIQVRRPIAQKQAHRFAIGLAVALGILLLALSIACPILFPVFRFPRPGGSYAIGTVTYDWTDARRPEIFSADPKARRELMVQIWYPAKRDSSTAPAPYIPDADTVMAAMARLHHWPGFALKQFIYVTTHAAESVPIADDRPSYPVLIYMEGHTGYRQMTNFQVEELVSHGYIVAGVDQPGAAASVVFPDGHQIAIVGLFPQIQALVNQSLSPAEKAPRLNGQSFKNGIIPYFAQDVSFVLDRLASINTADPRRILTGKLDLQNTAVFGMSLGGMVCAEACLEDPRIKAALIEDVAITADVVQRGLQQPIMLITRPAGMMRLERRKTGGWAEKDILQTQSTMHELYNGLPGDGYFVQIPGTFHIDFTDLNLISPIFPTIGFSGPIGARRAHDIINAYSVAFFDKHLKCQLSPLLNGPAKQFPDVLFETRRP